MRRPKARSSTRAIGVPATFLTGLADDVGVAPGRAARLVDAAVAARTRGELLQAGAQVRAGEEGAAMLTLDGIIGILGTFPPERGSAEFEMVAAGLTSRLTEAERAKLLDAFRAIGGGEEQTRAVAEALGADTLGLNEREAAQLAIDTVWELNQDLAIPAKLSEVGVKKSGIRALAKATMQSGNIAVNPRKTSQLDIETIFRKAI